MASSPPDDRHRKLCKFLLLPIDVELPKGQYFWDSELPDSSPPSTLGLLIKKLVEISGLWLRARGVTMRIRPSIAFLCTLLSFTLTTRAQQITQRPMITQAVDESRLVTLKGNTHPLARPLLFFALFFPSRSLRARSRSRNGR